MIGQDKTVYDWRHYLAVVQRKPGALRNGAPFAELPEAFRTCSSTCSRSRADPFDASTTCEGMVDILALVLQHDEQAVLLGVDMALEVQAFRPRRMS